MTPPNKTPQETVDRILALNGQGLTLVETARRCGVSRSTLYRILRAHGETADGRRNPRTAAGRAKTRRRLVRMEMRRLLGGERQETRLRLAVTPSLMRRALNRLQREYGYIYDTDATTLYYTHHTERRLNTRCGEDYYADKYGVTFRPLVE